MSFHWGLQRWLWLSAEMPTVWRYDLLLIPRHFPWFPDDMGLEGKHPQCHSLLHFNLIVDPVWHRMRRLKVQHCTTNPIVGRVPRSSFSFSSWPPCSPNPWDKTGILLEIGWTWLSAILLFLALIHVITRQLMLSKHPSPNNSIITF